MVRAVSASSNAVEIAAVLQGGNRADSAHLGHADHVAGELRQTESSIQLGKGELGIALIDPELGTAARDQRHERRLPHRGSRGVFGGSVGFMALIRNPIGQKGN
jgi:hypothetical protein